MSTLAAGNISIVKLPIRTEHPFNNTMAGEKSEGYGNQTMHILIDVGNAIINLTARDKANHRSMFHSSSTSIFQFETMDAHGLSVAHVQVGQSACEILVISDAKSSMQNKDEILSSATTIK